MLIIFIESAFSFADLYMYEPPYEGLRVALKNREARNISSNYDIVFFGDCYFSAAIPKIIEQKTGQSVFNFSTGAGHGVFSQYAFIKNYLEHAKPKHIFLGFIVLTSAQSRKFIEENKITNYFNFIEGNFSLFQKEFGTVTALRMMIPSLKWQFKFKRLEIWKNPFQKFSLQDTEREAENYLAEGGWQKPPTNFVYDGQVKDIGVMPVFPVSDFFKKYTIKIVQMAQESGAEVYIIIPSLPPDVYEVRMKYGAHLPYFKFLEEIRKQYPDIQFINVQTILNEKYYYMDWTHLNQEGSRIFSEVAAQIVQKNKS